MRALVVVSPGVAEVQEISEPVASPGELLVAVERVGICGTDVELYTGEMAYIEQGYTTFPLRLGHEWAGRVVATGSPDDAGWMGKLVTGDTMLGCGRCSYCQSGHQHVCPDRNELGIRGDWAGALAELMVIPTRFALAIPDTVSLAAAALVEPGGNSLRAVQAAAIEPGQRVLIIGAGTIGLLCAQFALAEGADVFLAGVRSGALALARELGVRNVLTIAELEDGFDNAFDSVIDATSLESVPEMCIRLVRPAGRLVYIGLSSTPSTVDTRDIVLRDISVVGILSASPGLAGAIAAFASGAVVPDRLVSEVVALDEVPSRLEGQRGENVGPGPKVQVDPRL